MKFSYLVLYFLSAFNVNASTDFFYKSYLTEYNKSSKKVFALYMSTFSVRTYRRVGDDYFTRHWLNPFGENSKFLFAGSFFRDRPADSLMFSEKDESYFNQDILNQKKIDFLREVKLAQNIGIDGFMINIFCTSSPWTEYAKALDDNASNFKLVLMPDPTGECYRNLTPNQVFDFLLPLTKFKSIYKDKEDRIVFYPFGAESKNEEWWKGLLDNFAKSNIKTSFVPITITSGPSNMFSNMRSGVSWWGVNNFLSFKNIKKLPYQILKESEIILAPVRPEDVRPKKLIGWESSNSSMFREMWEDAITKNVDQVHIITWNDFTESTHIIPSIGKQWALYDLTGYYIEWFKSGKKPNITKDTLFYFHRNQPSTGKFNTKYQLNPIIVKEPENNIEILSFLTKPGIIVTNILNKKTTQYVNHVPEGISSIKNPLNTGEINIVLYRNNLPIIKLKSKHKVYNPVNTQDFSYKAGGSNRK